MKISRSQSIARISPDNSNHHLYLPDGSRYLDSTDQKQEPVIVRATVALAPGPQYECRLLEVIRDPERRDKLAFVDWRDGRWEIVPQVKCCGRLYTPDQHGSALFSQLTVPAGVGSREDTKALRSALREQISDLIDLQDRHIVLVQAFVMASWFADLYDDIPYLAIVGPLGSAKTKLLKLLSCLCRRALLVGDVRAAALYQLAELWEPTLLIDEFEIGGARSDREILRLLRTGSTRGVGTVRNGRFFPTFGFKVIAARQMPSDAALQSRFVAISLLPSTRETEPFNEKRMSMIAEQFQPRLLRFRLANCSEVCNFQLKSDALSGMTPRARQLARVLAAPLADDPEALAELIAVLREQDGEMHLAQSLEPEWLVVEALFAMCHEHLPLQPQRFDILVGGIAAEVCRKLHSRGENFRLSSRRVGAVLQSLGFKTERLGNLGRGLRMTSLSHKRVHQVARRLGISRVHITPISALDAGNGGRPCPLCEEIGLTAGLHYFDLPKPRRRSIRPRVPLFDSNKPEDVNDAVGGNGSAKDT